MKLNRKRAMKIVVKDDGRLEEMLQEHKLATNESLKFHREELKEISLLSNLDELIKRRNKLCCKIEARVKDNTTTVSRAVINYTARMSNLNQ